MDWAEARYEVDFFKKCLSLAGLFFKLFVPRMGSFLEMPLFVAMLKKCDVENDAEGLKTYFATDFGIIFCNFWQIFFVGRDSRRLSNPLSIYDQVPYFPFKGSGPIFHMALFFHWGLAAEAKPYNNTNKQHEHKT